MTISHFEQSKKNALLIFIQTKYLYVFICVIFKKDFNSGKLYKLFKL